MRQWLRRIALRTGGNAKVTMVASHCPTDATLSEVRNGLQKEPGGELFVVDAEGCLKGIITFAELQETAFDDSHDKDWRSLDVTHATPTVLRLNEDPASAVRVFAACRVCRWSATRRAGSSSASPTSTRSWRPSTAPWSRPAPRNAARPSPPPHEGGPSPGLLALRRNQRGFE